MPPPRSSSPACSRTRNSPWRPPLAGTTGRNPGRTAPLPPFDTSLALAPLSPLVVVEGQAPRVNAIEYLPPDHPRTPELLLENLISKYVAYQSYRQSPVDPTLASANVQVQVQCHKPPKSRLVTLKADTAAETRVRGFYEGFSLTLNGPAEILRIGYLSGLGRYNASGFGCFGVREN
ncbi:MAG: hypothetical protein HC880_08330 [Bacteroidia bacterium]|nr:hypothetical protein [Bacteroidia bacterium]